MSVRVALVLGGGGSRGLAHLGVINVLQRENIPIDFIVGTSMGAIIGSLFSRGLSHREITQTLAKLTTNQLGARSLISAQARQEVLSKLLSPYLAGFNLEDLAIPLRIMAVDLASGQEVCLDSGAVLPAVLASSAIPAVFPPVEHMGMLLGDGGIIDNLATWAASGQDATCIIAVDVYPGIEDDEAWADPLGAIMGLQAPASFMGRNGSPGAIPALWRSFRIMACYIHDQRLKDHPPHILLRPDLQSVASLDFSDIYTVIETGRRAAENNLAQIRSILQSGF